MAKTYVQLVGLHSADDSNFQILNQSDFPDKIYDLPVHRTSSVIRLLHYCVEELCPIGITHSWEVVVEYAAVDRTGHSPSSVWYSEHEVCLVVGYRYYHIRYALLTESFVVLLAVQLYCRSKREKTFACIE